MIVRVGKLPCAIDFVKESGIDRKEENLQVTVHFKMFEFLTDECVSDHNERIRSIQIDKFFSYPDVSNVQPHHQ